VPETVAVDANKSVYFLTTIRTNLDAHDFEADCLIDFRNANEMVGQLLAIHIQEWKTELWQSGVEVAGNVALAAAINASLYEILSSTRDDWIYGISPGGIAIDSYNGHIFWDCETCTIT
jgi:trehalose/maltose hydrolase-like predicted phosphorylase